MPPEVPDAPVGLQRVHIEAATDGLVLTLEVEHHYTNPTARPIEVIYSFPVPSDAVILGVTARLDGRPLTAALRERAAAEDMFETLQEEGGFAALVERVSSGVCTASLGRLDPGQTAVLRTRLGRFLDVAGGWARIAIPTVVTLPKGSRRAGGMEPLGAATTSLFAQYPLSVRLALFRAASKARAHSPTHRLEEQRTEDAVVFQFAEPAMLDRDVVVTLTGLPDTDYASAVDWRAGIGVVGFTPTEPVDRQAMTVVVLVDASGPLGPIVGDVADVVDMLTNELEDGDGLFVAKLGRILAPSDPLAVTGDQPFDGDALGALSADLGDLPVGQDLPLLNLATGADVLFVTDGRTRVAEALADRMRAEGRRLFVLAAGAAPDEGWLRPAAEATGGDYVGITPHEPIEPGVHRLLGAMTLMPAGPPALMWPNAPAWTVVPDVWRFGRRGLAFAGFEKGAPSQVVIQPAEGDQKAVNGPTLIEDRDPLAEALVRLAAAKRFAVLVSSARAAWAARYDLPVAGGSWIASAPGSGGGAGGGAGEARLIETPHMTPAGWRGIGVISPIPDLAQSVPPPAVGPISPPPGRGSRGRSIAWIAAGVMALALCGTVGWIVLRPPDAPSSIPAALPDRLVQATEASGTPRPLAPQAGRPSEGARPMDRIWPGFTIAALMVAAVIAWLVRSRRRRR